jgi:hypothetical protein
MEPYQERGCGGSKKFPQDMPYHCVHRVIVTTFSILLNREPLPPLGVIQQAFQSIDLALLNLERLPQAANLFFERFNFEIFSYNEFIQRGGARDSWGPVLLLWSVCR